MAVFTVRIHNETFTAVPEGTAPQQNGNWLVRPLVHSARCAAGSLMEVTPNEVLKQDWGGGAAAAPSAAELATSAGAMQAAMAKQLEQFPSAKEILSTYQADAAGQRVGTTGSNAAPGAGVQPMGGTVTTTSKFASVADRIRAMRDKLAQQADQITARVDALEAKAPQVLAEASAHLDQHEADIAALESFIRPGSNGGPPLDPTTGPSGQS